VVPFDNLEQGLLNPFSGNVPGNGGVVRFAGDLVDFVDVDDPALGLFHIVVGILQQRQDDVFHILAHIAGLGQAGGIGDGKRHVEKPRQGLGKQRFTAARGADQQDVALLDLHIAGADGRVQPFVVVVYGHRQVLLGHVLFDHVVVQPGLDLLGNHQVFKIAGLFFILFFNDLAAQLNALIANIYSRSGDQLFDLLLVLPAERTEEILIRLVFFGHVSCLRVG
jgi:hypothetical protein